MTSHTATIKYDRRLVRRALNHFMVTRLGKSSFLLSILALCFLSGCGEPEVPKTDKPTPLVSIDCTESGLGNLSAGFVLGWVADLTEENGGSLSVQLRGERRNVEFLFLVRDLNSNEIQIDVPIIEFRKEGPFVNNEQLPDGGFDEWLATYIEAAQIADVEPLLLIRGSHFIPIKDCVANFERLYDRGIKGLVLWSSISEEIIK